VNYAARKSEISCTVTPPVPLKSATLQLLAQLVRFGSRWSGMVSPSQSPKMTKPYAERMPASPSQIWGQTTYGLPATSELRIELPALGWSM